MTRARLRAIMVVCFLVAGCGGSASRTGRVPAPSTALPTTPSTSSTSARPPAQPRKRRAASAGHRPKPPHRAVPVPGASKPAQPVSPAPTKPTAPAAPGSVNVTLALHGGGNLTLGDCGAQHHYRLYPVGSTVTFSGSVSPLPSGKWKVKLKIKVCRGSDFVELTKLDASQNRHTGAFSGSFPAPASGAYKARAELYLGTNDIARSGQLHFATR